MTLPLLPGLVSDSTPSHESRFQNPSPSPSQSGKNWTRVRVIKKWTRVRTRVRVPTRVTQHWSGKTQNSVCGTTEAVVTVA